MPSFVSTQDLVDGNKRGAGTAASNQVIIADRGNSWDHGVKLSVGGTVTGTYNGTANGTSGAILLYTLPSGVVQFKGAEGSVTLTRTSSNTTATDTAPVVVSLGTVQAGTDNATLTSTEANIVPSTAFTLSSGATGHTLVGTTANIVDGGTAGNAVYLNYAIPAANSSGAASFSLSGSLALGWYRPSGL